ncbi:MAG: histidinol-phosphatase HisJ family protein [Clostridiales bacterium]|nr:histidinol-phosphatase HisJ family protein [Clostridiales bacterium]
MYSDCHMHTSFSSDSETPPEHQIEEAIRLGMKHLTITDHYDLDFPPGELDFLFDSQEYWKKMTELREKYAHRISLRIGVELGLQPHLTQEIPAFASSLPFDYIIGSTHVSRRIDPYEREQFIKGISEEEAYRIYFEDELKNLKTFDCYDVVGHLDYVVRYGPNQNRYYSYEKYRDVLDAILEVIIDKGKGLECNTAGWKAGLGMPHPLPHILRRYHELGGRLITLGSDAHTPEALGYSFPKAGELLKDCGFRYYAVFQNRTPEFFPL